MGAHEEQQRFLAEIGVVLAHGLDQTATLRRIAEASVPELADWAIVYLVAEDGTVRRLAIAHRDEAADLSAATMEDHPSIDAAAGHGVPLVIRTGRPILEPEVSPEAVAADAMDPEGQTTMLAELGLRSWICVPLTARGETFGALSLLTAESGRTFAEADLAFAEQVAQRAALALDNARLHAAANDTAALLQRSLLPQRLPALPGAAFAARYVPGGPGAEVGGDWYDALALDDGALAVAIGDVAGSGVQAAAVMGQLRTALRAYLTEGHAPEAALALLGRFVDGLEPGVIEMATALALRWVPGTGALRVAGAGHLPPLLVAADGSASLLALPPSPPLGALASALPRVVEATLAPGSTVVLYTDGLVERRGEPLTAGLDRLAVAAGRAVPGDPEALCDALLAGLVAGRERLDDVAIIALRRAG